MATSSSIPSNYTHLQNLLAEQHWQAADEETAKLMLKIAGRETEGWLDPQAIAQFPCADLKIIDQLWTEYSQGRFGFTAQKNIWLECGRQINYDTECRLGSRVGWYADGKGWLYIYENNRIFNLTAPPGHLPLLFSAKTGVLPRWMRRVEVMQSAIASRLANCSCTDDIKERQDSTSLPQMNATYEQKGKTFVVQIPPQPSNSSTMQQTLQTPEQIKSIKNDVRQLWNAQLNKFRKQFERPVESLEADPEFGNFIASYNFQYERDKYLGLSLFMTFMLVLSLPFLFLVVFAIPLFFVFLWTAWQTLMKRVRISRRQIFLYQNGIRVFQRSQETRIAGRDLMVWQKTVNVFKRGMLQRTDYSYRVRLPYGDEFVIETQAFGEAICQLVLRTQLLEKLIQFERGESIVFGPIHLTSEAIFVKKKRMSWSKSPKFNIRRGLFYVSSKFFFPSVECSEIPNLNVLAGVLQANDYFVD